MGSLLALGSNAWGSLLHARSALMGFPNHCNIAYLNVPKPNTLGRLMVWQKWGASDDVALSWPFTLSGNLVVKREDDPPKIQDYHVSGFSFIL